MFLKPPFSKTARQSQTFSDRNLADQPFRILFLLRVTGFSDFFPKEIHASLRGRNPPQDGIGTAAPI